MIYLLMIILFFLLFLSLKLNKKDIISPAFVFCFGFVFQIVWAVIYAEKWQLGLHVNTFLVIIFGVFEFLVVSYVFSVMYKKKYGDVEKTSNEYIEINKNLKNFYLLFVIIFSFIYLYYIVEAVGGNFNKFTSVSDAISRFDSLSKFSDEYDVVKLPFLITNIQTIVIASGYWFLYIFINNFISSHKLDVTSLFIVLATMICSSLNGSRTETFMMITSGIVIFLIIYSKNKKYENVLNFKIIKNIFIIGLVFLCSFLSFATLLGRNIKESPLNYLSIYCGAEVKNLDLFLQDKNFEKQNNIFGSQTFYSVVTTIGEKVGFKNYKKYRLDLPAQKVGKYSLGNVYTTFYPFIYDFGYIGVVILVMIMAIISQYVYEKVKHFKFTKSPSIYILTYSIVFCCLLLSFFSNKFYENIISMRMLKFLFAWIMLKLIFCKLNFKKDKYQEIEVEEKV